MPISEYFECFGAETPEDDAAAFSTSAPFDQGLAHHVPFKLPSFMFMGPPAIAPGGGAEVLQSDIFSAPYSSFYESAGIEGNLLNSEQ
jgi:hypothetical protein